MNKKSKNFVYGYKKLFLIIKKRKEKKKNKYPKHITYDCRFCEYKSLYKKSDLNDCSYNFKK
jgi:hypothetical protein